MFLEGFLTYIARKRNADCLQFEPSHGFTVPPKQGHVPALLYVHIPFCEELCPYCSFNRIVFREGIARAYFGALRREIVMYSDRGYDFKALYVGGGTPTVLLDELSQTIGLVKKLYGIREISVETNPNHLTKDRVDTLRSLGVNRLSVGVQTFEDDLLKLVERYRKYGCGEEIADRLASVKGVFDTLNVDMIFNFPAQTPAALERDLAKLLEIDVDQITYYPLMVSAATRDTMGKKLGWVDYGRGNSFYQKIMEALSSQYHSSTAWCFSKRDTLIDEYVVSFDEYAGLGSGSIGYLGGSAYANTFDVEEYITRVNRGEFPAIGRKVFSIKERLRYDFLMKLFGMSLDLRELKSKHQVNAIRLLLPEICFFLVVGGIKKEGHLLTLTRKGQYYWIIMMREFFISVNNFRDFCRGPQGMQKNAS
jgi:menaquinone C8-methyltransferase